MIQIIAFSSKAAITFITTAPSAPARKLSGERKEKLNIYLLYPIPPSLSSFSNAPRGAGGGGGGDLEKRNCRTERRINLVKVPLHLSASERLLPTVTMAALVLR